MRANALVNHVGSCQGQRWIGHVALYVPQLCVILLVGPRLCLYGLTHIPSHAAFYSCWFQFDVLFLNVHPGSYFWWLQLQHRGDLTGVCVAAVSTRVALCLKCLSFGSIRLQSHLVAVCLERWVAVVERWGGWSWSEVGSPEDYKGSYKSKWNEWQPKCSSNSSWIRLRIAALYIAAGGSNGPAICSKSVWCCLFVCRDISWWTTADIWFLIDMKRTFFDGKDVWWCLSQDIAGILHESHANHQVSMYCQHDYSQWCEGQNADFACSNWWNLPTLT